MVSKPIHLTRHIYKIGDYVEAFHEGFWQLGIIRGMRYVKGIGYNVWLTNKNEHHDFSDKVLKPSDTFSQEIAKEFEEEMEDLTQDIVKEKAPDERVQVPVTDDPWLGDSQNFIDPKPMKPPTTKAKRFLEVSDKEIDMLQDQSKSSKTHKMTAWGVKQLTGNNIVLPCLFQANLMVIILFQLMSPPLRKLQKNHSGIYSFPFWFPCRLAAGKRPATRI